MKILYVTEARLPTEKAHGIQISKTCEALARAGADVTLIHPWRLQVNEDLKDKDAWTAYGIERNFRIVTLPCIDLLWLEHVLHTSLLFAYPIMTISFGIIATLYALLSGISSIYSRHFLTVALLTPLRLLSKKRLFYEAHDFPTAGLMKRFKGAILSRIQGTVVITERLSELYRELGVEKEGLLVASDAVDIERFSGADPVGIRKDLQLPEDTRIVCYTGNLYRWKGVHTLALSEMHLPPDCHIIIVGGSAADHNITEFKEFIESEGIENVTVTGFIPHDRIPGYLADTDVLVLPNSAQETMSREYTSPLKLFEYMASGKPIVASDLPSLREVLNEDNALLVEPDDPRILARGIMQLLEDEELANALADQAFINVQEHSWENRAKKILAFIDHDTTALPADWKVDKT